MCFEQGATITEYPLDIVWVDHIIPTDNLQIQSLQHMWEPFTYYSYMVFVSNGVCRELSVLRLWDVWYTLYIDFHNEEPLVV